MSRPGLARVLCVAWAAASAAAPLLPFLRAGERVRSGYELIRSATSAGVLEGTDGRIALLALSTLPVIAVGALLAAVLRATMVTATFAMGCGVISAVAGAVTWRSPVETEAGPWIAMTVGAATMATAIATVVTAR